MPKTKAPDPKLEALRRSGSLNPRPDKVTDPLFSATDFFDPRDILQVKYEMVRRVRVDRQSVSHSAKTFGFSRPAFYQADAAFERGGIPALAPKKRGPRHRHKLSTTVMDFVLLEKQAEPGVASDELARRVLGQFGIRVHPRSVERALSGQKKKRH